MTPALMEAVAERFRALGEPMRLRILDALRNHELTVSELVTETGATQANVSRHLSLLHSMGFVKRRKAGSFVYYSVADEEVFALCDLVCGSARDQAGRELEALSPDLISRRNR